MYRHVEVVIFTWWFSIKMTTYQKPRKWQDQSCRESQIWLYHLVGIAWYFPWELFCWVRQTAEPTRVFLIVSVVIMYDTNSMLMTVWKKCSMPWHSSSKKTVSHCPDHLSSHQHIYNSILFPSSSYMAGWVGNLFKSVKNVFGILGICMDVCYFRGW